MFRLGFLKVLEVFIFFIRRPNTKVAYDSRAKAHKTSHTWYALLLFTAYNMQNYCIYFEYEVYLLNYTIKIKNLKKHKLGF